MGVAGAVAKGDQRGRPRVSPEGRGSVRPPGLRPRPLLVDREDPGTLPASGSLEASLPNPSQSGNRPAPPPSPGPRRSLARAHREPGREKEMSFPAARWRCQLIGRGRGPRAVLGASLAAAGAQLSGKNWGGRCGEISYRSLGGAAGPRSALTAADLGPARRAGAARRGQGWGKGGPPPPSPLPLRLPAALLHLLRLLPAPSSRPLCLSPLPFIPPPWYRPKADPELTGVPRPQHRPPRLVGLGPGARSEC